MKALVVYESMFGNTHAIAERIAAGLRPAFDVTVVPVTAATPDLVGGADLVVAGGPTHVHGMTRPSTRTSAFAMAAKPDNDLGLDPSAVEASGIREWLDGVAGHGTAAAAFDTRMQGPAMFTGRAGRVVARRLRKRGFRIVVPPESFLVDKQTRLVDGEEERAERWAADLGSSTIRHPAAATARS